VGGHADVAGSSVQWKVVSPAAAECFNPQKIGPTAAGQSAAHMPNEDTLCQMIGKIPKVQAGSSVKGNGEAKGVFSHDYDANNEHDIHMGNFQQDGLISFSQTVHSEGDYYNAGVGLEPNVFSSFGLADVGITNTVGLSSRGDLPNMGIQDSVGVASSPISVGKSLSNSCTPLSTAKSKVCLSLIEGSSENMTVRPTMEEVIAFGEIPKSSLSARTSARLGGRPGVDMCNIPKISKQNK
jgi:hypothetical protein